MRRNGYIVLLVVVLAWVVAAIALRLSRPRPVRQGARSQDVECDLARLPADDARPQRQPARHRRRRLTRAGNRHRQPGHPDQLPRHERREHPAKSRSSALRSGNHRGHVHAYYQGDGGSFVPDKPFDPGERVLVRGAIRSGGARALGTAHAFSFAFRIDTPYPTASVPEFANPPAAPADYQSFDTMPGVQAPILDVTVPDRDPAAGDILTTNGPGSGSVRAADLHAAGSARLVRQARRAAKRRRTSASRPTKASAT